MRVDVPYLFVVTKRHAGGVRRHAYYRRGGVLTPIRALDGRTLLPGESGFLDAYNAIARSYVKAAPSEEPGSGGRSIAALVASYLKSDGFREKASATQEQYRRVMGELVERFGAKSAVRMELPQVQQVREAFGGRATPTRANRVVQMLSILFEHSRVLGWRTANPAKNPKRLRTGPGFKTWTSAEFAAFMASDAVGEPMKRAAALAFYTGGRVGDLAALPRTARREGAIVFTPKKTKQSTGALVHVAEHPDLTTILDAAPPSSADTLLTRADGKAWGLDNLKHSMAKAVAAAGLPRGLSFHGLRAGLSAALAESGSSDAELNAVIPHQSPALTAHYRRHASQKTMAAAAIARLPGHTGRV